MGDPRKNRRKFSTPFKAWDRARIEEEKGFIREYYFKNKTEIWKLTSKLRNFKKQAKRLIALKLDPQAQKEKIQLLRKVSALGLIPEESVLEDLLGVAQKDIFDRRLQSIVFKRGLAKSMKQARQFITHGHICVGERKLTSPNCLVLKSQEGSIGFYPGSDFSDPMHPERIQEKKMAPKPEPKEVAADKKEEKKEAKKERPAKKKEPKAKPAKEEKQVKKE